jgi:hypothetical protein
MNGNGALIGINPAPSSTIRSDLPQPVFSPAIRFAPEELSLPKAARHVAYLAATAAILWMMGHSALLHLSHGPVAMGSFSQLGYPPYFPNILGGAELFGVCALLVPGLPVLKKRAYAGFAFVLIGMFISRIASGQKEETIAPLIARLLLTMSYFLRPVSRRVVA